MKFARILFGLASFSLVVPSQAVAHHTTSHASCAPVFKCLFGGCWYELLNNPAFSGTHSSCTGWSGATVTTSTDCFNSAAAVITPGVTSMQQSFSVPSGTTGTLELIVEFATLGTPASASDRLVFDLYEGLTLRETISISTMNSALYCHGEAHYFDDFNYASRNLKLVVRAISATPGVTYHINSVDLFAP